MVDGSATRCQEQHRVERPSGLQTPKWSSRGHEELDTFFTAYRSSVSPNQLSGMTSQANETQKGRI
ncbi:hypothetical protein E2C01_087940 [Portunus trituberculatus]|uniref:Uncharacterized protein n=1 Tax=Portunus trituberculatus TaxID=210409 RepID=A0A5B7J7X2_PORTR|nr:hypothetical protein [Portunus trituberculatus]